MAGHHHHHGCGHEHDDGEHEHPDDGEQQLLYTKIDLDNVELLNAVDGNKPSDVIKPWDQRNTSDNYIESDADEQLLIKIPFTGSVKLRSIIVKGGGEGMCPKLVKLHINEILDFDEASSKPSVQDVEIAQHKEAIEYPLRTAKFPNVQNLSVFIPSNYGDEQTRIYFIGFKGDFTAMKKEAVNVVYEAQANPADHAKIRGMDGMGSNLGM